MPTVGVLALQGDVREHREALVRCGADVVDVRRPDDLARCDGLVMPGGESTAIAHLLESAQLRAPLAARLRDGLPTLGTCAGLILLATDVLDGRSDQWSFAALDVAVRRNGYGRQVASFEAAVDVAGVGQVTGVFIRAPRIESVGDEVEVLARHDHGQGDDPVLVRQGAVWGCAFHPELTRDDRLHAAFLATVGTTITR